jgi:hypothetical protein
MEVIKKEHGIDAIYALVDKSARKARRSAGNHKSGAGGHGGGSANGETDERASGDEGQSPPARNRDRPAGGLLGYLRSVDLNTILIIAGINRLRDILVQGRQVALRAGVQAPNANGWYPVLVIDCTVFDEDGLEVLPED